MSYRLKVEPKDYCLDYWESFMEKSGFLDCDDYPIDHYLEPYRAKNVPNTPYIEFETEADATMFILKWS